MAEVTLSQGLSLTLGDHSARSSFKIYGDTRKLVDGISTSPTISVLELQPFYGAHVPYYWLISQLTI